MKNLLLILFIILCSLLTIHCFAQSVFQKAIGGLKQDEAYTIIKAIDNGYIICGFTDSYGAGGKDVLVIKIDILGNILWAKAYGGSNDDYGNKIIATKDNSYLITAFTYSYGQGDRDGLLIKIDINGNLIWAKAYGTPYEEIFHETIESDNGYIVVGSTQSLRFDNRNGIVLSLDKSGNIIWQKSFSPSNVILDGFISVIKTRDNNFMATGGLRELNYEYLIEIWKFDIDGNVIWYNDYSSGGNDYNRSANYSNDNGYILSGSSDAFSSGGFDCLALEISEAGSLNWSYIYGGNKDEWAFDVKNVSNFGYILTGYTESFGFSNRKVYALRLDNTGNLLWSKAFGGKGWDGRSNDVSSPWNFRNVLSANDKGFLIADYTESFGAGNGDVYLIKTDSLGNTANCAMFTPPTQSKSLNFTVTPGVQDIEAINFILTVPNLIVTNINPKDFTICSCNLSISLGRDTTTCQGNSITLNPLITPDTLNPTHYLWNNKSTNKNVTVNKTGTYSVTVTDNSCSASDSVKVTIASPVEINPAFHNEGQCIGDSIAFTLNPTAGTPPFSYQWLLNGNTISGATNSLYSKANINISDSGKYSCIISNVCNSLTGDVVTLIPIVCNRIHHTISGYVTYDNKAQTPMSSKTASTITYVYLYNSGDTLIATTQTDDNGYYGFVNIINGSYYVTGNSNKPWGGGNPIDGLLVDRDYINITKIPDALWRAAGDVDADGKLTPADALLIDRRYIHLILQFPKVSDWLFEKIKVTLASVDLTVNIKAVCYGDVNGSYTPPF